MNFLYSNDICVTIGKEDYISINYPFSIWATLFLELLERQFTIDENHQNIQLRSASDFANQLNVHVDNLNKAIKETTSKTTTEIITDRILQSKNHVEA